MKKQTFIAGGIACLALIAAGFVLTYLNKALYSLIAIGAGALIFWLIYKQAKKESWFGKKKITRY